MSTIFCISDLHLDQSTAGIDRFEDGSKVLDRAVEHALDVQADAFFFVGDLCDPHTVRAHRSVAKLAEAQAKLYRGRVRPVLLAGNHDVIEDGSGGSVLDVLVHAGMGHVITRPQCFGLQNMAGRHLCNLIALPFTPTSHNYDPDKFIREDAEISGNLSDPVVVIGHLNLEGITVGSETTEMPRGRDVFWPLAALKELFPSAILIGGHYHTPQDFNGVHIVGSAVCLRFDEKGNWPGYMVVEI